MIRPFVAATLCVCLVGWNLSLLADQVEEEAARPSSTTKKAINPESVSPAGKSGKKLEKGAPNKYERLPRYYGKLDLSADQRSKVYSVQEEFGKQIDDLLRQVDALKSEREKKVKSFLSASQKRMLTTLENAALASRTKPKE